MLKLYVVILLAKVSLILLCVFMLLNYGLEDVLLHGHGIFLFKFNDVIGLQHVIDNGP